MNPNLSKHWSGRLSEYLDGDLGPSERDDCAAHLRACPECARLLEELKSVATHARSLPVTPPPAELWAAIEARLETPVLRMRPRAALRERLARRFSFSGLQLAGAAAALIAVTVASMWSLTPRAPRSVVVREPVAVAPGVMPDRATPAPASDGAPLAQALAPKPTAEPRQTEAAAAQFEFDPERPAPTAAADFGVRRYDAAIAELEAVLDARRTSLAPETIRIVEANLAIVDKAIADARGALVADPANRYLNAHLANTMRRKVDLLRRVNALTRV